MAEYLVSWSIYVEAESPLEAARVALAVQRSEENEALGFEVADEAGHRCDVCVPDGRPRLVALPGGRADKPRAVRDRSADMPHLRLVG